MNIPAYLADFGKKELNESITLAYNFFFQVPLIFGFPTQIALH
jgi:hypothetical protein